jgi:hypothetical protein
VVAIAAARSRERKSTVLRASFMAAHRWADRTL